MIKPSKYLLAFSSISVILGIAVFIASQKFLPLLLQHTVYYCQSLLQSFSLRLPGGLGTALTSLLLLVIGIAFTKFIVTYIKVVLLRKKLHRMARENPSFNKITRELNLSEKAYLVEDKKPFAFCHGIRHPKIYLSTALFSMIDTNELEAIMLHEKYHLEHKDSFIMFLAELTRSLFPFFPLLSDLIHNYKIEREVAADHESSHALGSPTPLVSVLKKLLSAEPMPQYSFAPALADHETLEVRIKTLMKKKPHVMQFRFSNALISLLSIGIFFALVVAPVHAVEMHDQETDVMMVCLQSDACAVWCKENQTVVPYSKMPSASYQFTPANQTPLR